MAAEAEEVEKGLELDKKALRAAIDEKDVAAP